VKSSGNNGDNQNWYFNNPLSTPYSVTVRDANGTAVPDVSVDWAITTGDGTLSPDPSTTNSSGVATTVHTLGADDTYTVTASVTGLASVSFTANASAPPPTADVEVGNNFFNPDDAVVQTGGTVTWTWNSGGVVHDVDYDGGPTPLPESSIPQGSGTHSNTITTVGTYTYHCNFHGGMNGTVTVVN
jgi:plastocyanin